MIERFRPLSVIVLTAGYLLAERIDNTDICLV